MACLVALDIRFDPARQDDVRAVIDEVLAEARAFDGCLGVGVLVDAEDPGHWVGYERWESAEHDAAYRRFRAASGTTTGLGPLLDAPPTLTRFTEHDSF